MIYRYHSLENNYILYRHLNKKNIQVIFLSFEKNEQTV